MRPERIMRAAAGVLLTAGVPFLAHAADDPETLQRQVEELQRQLEEVQDKLNEQEDARQSQASSTAAFHWPDADSAVHLSGYAAVGYTDAENGNGAFNAVSFNPIFHYQYRDLFLLEAELEIAVEESGETETALEYGAIDWFINDYALLQTGKFLSPIGQFRQNLHPAWINKFASAPPGFGEGGAAPVAEVGAQLRGGYRWGNPWRLNYALYAGNGPKVEIAGTEIDRVNSEGATGNDDGKLLFGGRVGVLPLSSLEIGISAASGEVGPEGEEALLRDYDVYGTDFSWQPGKSWDFRGEYVKTKVGDNTVSAAPESAEWATWYMQGAYRFLTGKWEAVLRYADFDSPHADADQEQWGGGLNYWFAPNAVGKAGYERNEGLPGNPSDDDRWLLQLSYGF